MSLLTTPRTGGRCSCTARATRLADGLLLAALAGCGSAPPEQAGPAVPVAAALPAPPTGPCDASHQAHALEVAASAAERVFGKVELGVSTASFGTRYTQPQLRGQAVPLPLYGWTVKFAVETVDRGVYDPSNPLAEHLIGPRLNGGGPPPSVAVAQPPQPGRTPEGLPNRTAPTLPQPLITPKGLTAPTEPYRPADARTILSPLVPIDPHGNQLQPMNVERSPATAQAGSQPAPGVQHLHGVLQIFVAVDGTATLL